MRPDLRLVEPEESRGVPGRRTVQIRGQAPARRTRRPSAAPQVGSRPDRVAMWAVLLGLFLVLVSAVS